MRNLAILLILLACAGASVAQVRVEVVLDRKQFVPNEKLTVGARIINHSGQTLKFGTDPDWLSFSVEASTKTTVRRNGEVPVLHEFSVASSEMGTRWVNLAPYFEMTKPGRYTVTATVKVREWNQEIRSQPAVVEIFPGTVFWEQRFGLPNSSKDGEAPEVRKYALLKVNHADGKNVYIQVTDEHESIFYTVFPVAPVIAGREPSTLVDQRSNLHVLAPYGRLNYAYYIVNPAGSILQRHRYEMSGNSHLALRVGQDGEIVVIGGLRKESPEDLPPPETAKLEPPAPALPQLPPKPE